MQEINLSGWNGQGPGAPPAASRVHHGAAASVCRQCWFTELCHGESQRIADGASITVRRVTRGEFLYLRGERLTSLYAVRSGFFKTQLVSEGGQLHVLGFQMSEDLLGLDGISQGVHTCETIALEDSMVCVLPYADLQRLADRLPGVSRRLHGMLAHEIGREQRAQFRLGRMSAQGRLVDFLLDLSERMCCRGFSASRLRLRMGREDIGNHLGLSFETVSRIFSRLQLARLLDVSGREIRILEPAALLASLSEE